MRVIAGALRGRRFESGPIAGLRPTADRVRESIFNILGTTVVDARVLDLFAGTGAFAIEAMSRGAEEATCVESDARVLAVLEQNLAGLDLDDRVRAVRGDALDYCRRMAEDGTAWDVVFCDPPYARDPAPLIDLAIEATWWTRVWVIEHGAAVSPSNRGHGLETRRYGDSAVTFVWKS